jgi:hypothetical protein
LRKHLSEWMCTVSYCTPYSNRTVLYWVPKTSILNGLSNDSKDSGLNLDRTKEAALR